MRKTGQMKQVCCLILIGVTVCGEMTPAWATAQAEREKKETQQKPDEANKAIKAVETNKAATQNQVDQLSVELTVLFSNIHILETDMVNGELGTAWVEQDYAATVKQESEQYSAMRKRIQYVYEQGDTEYLDVLFWVKNMADLLNRTEYMSDIYAYNRRQLETYRKAKQGVEDTKIRLSDEKAEMEAMELEYKEQQGQLESTVFRKKQEVSDFDARYTKTKKDAVAYAKTVGQKNTQTKKTQEEAARKAAEEVVRKKMVEEVVKKKVASTSGSNSTSSKRPTSSTGTPPPLGLKATTRSFGGTAGRWAIADYGLTPVEDPYVYGGTSLTSGMDCSGFIQRVYAYSGYSIPRNSTAQRNTGREVIYGDTEPGDLIRYAGRMAAYIEDGQIAHTSTPTMGTKVSSAAYRAILSVRRIIL